MFHVLSVILSVTLVLDVNCGIKDNLKSDFFSIYQHAAIETRDYQQRPVTPENITYYLFTKNNEDQYIQLNDENLDLLSNKKIVFIIHGWTGGRDAKWYEEMKNAFLINYKDYCVVQVDWAKPANQFYYVSSINTFDVAKIIANFIKDLYMNHQVKLEDILLVGHSLGGQVTGFVGKNIYNSTGQKLPRIIALDPAGPLFSQRPEDQRLNKDDAKVVEVIHSDGGTFGFSDATGTIDFFPNGGKSQPGCKRIDLADIKSLVDPIPCDHTRSVQYFIEAILNPTAFMSKKCDDWDSYKAGKCDCEEVAIGNLTTTATGKFFLETNKDKPFGKQPESKSILSQMLSILFG